MYKQNKQYSKAIEIYNQILIREPNFAPALYSKGYCYFKMKDYENAELNFRNAFEIESKNIVYLDAYIKTLCVRGKTSFSQKILLDFLKENPDAIDSPYIKKLFDIINKNNN